MIKYGSYFHDRELPTPNQCSAARAVCRLGLRELAKLTRTSTVTLQRYMTHHKPIYPPIVERMRSIFEQRGVEFVFGDKPSIAFASDAVGGEIHR